MEYTAVRYPTKEYRQYRPGSKGLNVHYKAFREQFYGNKAIIKRSFRTIHRNPSVGQYTDQRGIPTYAYKIPNGKLYKTAPLMDRLPRGGSVPRIVGSLGDVQGSEFFTEGTSQLSAAPGSSLNSPFLFGKASQTLQDATAQYQAQTGQPVNTKVIQSQPFKDFYTKVIKNTQEYRDAYNYHPENSQGIDELAVEQSTTELNAVTKQEELQLVDPAMQSVAPPPADTPDTPMSDVTRKDSFGFEPESDYQARDGDIYVPHNVRAQLTRSQYGSEMMVDYALENQDRGDDPLQNGLRIANPTTDTTMITNPGPASTNAQSSQFVMREFDDDVESAYHSSSQSRRSSATDLTQASTAYTQALTDQGSTGYTQALTAQAASDLTEALIEYLAGIGFSPQIRMLESAKTDPMASSTNSGVGGNQEVDMEQRSALQVAIIKAKKRLRRISSASNEGRRLKKIIQVADREIAPRESASNERNGRSSSIASDSKNSTVSKISSESTQSAFSKLADEEKRTQLQIQGAINAIGRAVTNMNLSRSEVNVLFESVKHPDIQKLFSGKKGRGNVLHDYFAELEKAVVDGDKRLQREILTNIVNLLKSKKRFGFSDPGSEAIYTRPSENRGRRFPGGEGEINPGRLEESEYAKKQKLDEGKFHVNKKVKPKKKKK